MRKLKKPLCLLLSLVILAGIIVIAPVSAGAVDSAWIQGEGDTYNGPGEGYNNWYMFPLSQLKDNFIICRVAQAEEPVFSSEGVEGTVYNQTDDIKTSDVRQRIIDGEIFCLTTWSTGDYHNLGYNVEMREDITYPEDDTYLLLNIDGPWEEEVDTFSTDEPDWYIYTWSDNEEGESDGIHDSISKDLPNDTNFPNKSDGYGKCRILGVQKKEKIRTTDDFSKGSDLRYVAVVDTELLKADDVTGYGFLVTKTSASGVKDTASFGNDNFGNMFTDGFRTSSNTIVADCFKKSNTISGNYGNYEDNTTPYKYITLAVNGTVEDETAYTVAVRFYLIKGGQVYYADYINDSGNKYDGCAANYKALLD